MTVSSPQADRWPQIDETRFTNEERALWHDVALVAMRFLQLREVHPAERVELVTHIHALQVYLLARVAYPKASRE